MTTKDLKKYKNKIIKIVLKKNKEIPFAYGTFIAYLIYDKIVKGYVMSHPYDIKKKKMIAGDSNFDPNDITSIDYATEEYAKTWILEYQKFHIDAIETCGYDIAEIEKFEINLNISHE